MSKKKQLILVLFVLVAAHFVYSYDDYGFNQPFYKINIDNNLLKKSSLSKNNLPKKTQVPKDDKTDKVKTTPPKTAPEGITNSEQTLLDLINGARADVGAAPLKFDMNVVKVARLKGQDMVDNNYFSHTSPTYGSPFDMLSQFNISYRTAGENIAGNSSINGAYQSWMNSSGHRQNIENDSYNYTGLGIINGSRYGKIFVQIFIGR